MREMVIDLVLTGGLILVLSAGIGFFLYCILFNGD